MRAEQIKVGEEYGAERTYGTGSVLGRVRVLERAPASRRSVQRVARWRVVRLDEVTGDVLTVPFGENGERVPSERTLTSREIVAPWPEAAERNRQIRAATEVKIAQRAAEDAQRAAEDEEIATLAAKLGVDAPSRTRGYPYLSRSEFRVTPAWLLDVLRKVAQ